MTVVTVKTIQQFIAQAYASSALRQPKKTTKHKSNDKPVQNQSIQTVNKSKHNTNLTLCLISILLVCSLNCQASVLEVINDSAAKIEVIIEPGEGRAVSTTAQIKRNIKVKAQEEVTINREDIENNEVFSIIGKGKVPSLYNRCKGLFIDKDYKIVFVNSKAGGLVCYAEEL